MKKNYAVQRVSSGLIVSLYSYVGKYNPRLSASSTRKPNCPPGLMTGGDDISAAKVRARGVLICKGNLPKD